MMPYKSQYCNEFHNVFNTRHFKIRYGKQNQTTDVNRTMEWVNNTFY